MKKCTCDYFNENFPIGTPIIYTNGLGNDIETSIRSKAWELGHGEVVVAIKGINGGIAISNIERKNSESH